jgi:hypothetical protein
MGETPMLRMNSAASSSSKNGKRLRRWGLRVGIGLLLTIISFYFAAPSGVGWIIGTKLKSELSTRMKARLSFSRLRYQFPYGVRLEKAHLLLPGENGAADSWVDIGQLDLSLAKLPLGTGPLVIENLAIDHPLVHLASPAETSSEPSTESTPAPVTQKLSDLFQLRKITVNAGRFEYDMSTPQRKVPKIVWGHLGVVMNTQPTNGGKYSFSVSVQDQPIASATAGGAFDIDSLQLDLDHFAVTLSADPAKRPEQVPPAVLDLIQKYQIAGLLTFQGSARMPLQSLNRTTFDMTAKLTEAHCQPPDFAGAIVPSEFVVSCSNHGKGCEFKLDARDEDLLSIQAAGAVDWNTQMLDLSTLEMSVAFDPQHVTTQLPSDLANLLQQTHLGGRVKLQGSAALPLTAPRRGRYVVDLNLKDGQYLPNGFRSAIQPLNCAIHAVDDDGKCAFDLSIADRDLIALESAGSLDLNSMLLDVAKVKLTVHCDPQSPIDQLPADVAQLLSDLQLGGDLTLEGRAKMPVRNLRLSKVFADVEMTNGHCRPIGWSAPVSPVTFSLAISNEAAGSATTRSANVANDPPAAPQEMQLLIRAFSAGAGNQLVRLNSGQVDFDAGKKTWAVSKVQGSMDIGDGPGPMEGANARIIMPFFASGEGKIGDPNSSLRIALDDGAAVITPNHIRINHINGMLTAKPNELRTSNITAKCAEGAITAMFGIRREVPAIGDKAITYKGRIQISKLDLHQLAMQYTTDPAKRQHAFGQLDWHQNFDGYLLADSPKSGKNSPADLLTGPGDFDVTNGYFLDIPLLKDIVGAMHMKNATTVGEVAGKYTIANSTVHFRKLIANSPALGVQGHGDLGFDQQAKMDFVAVPLADWAKDLRGSGLVDNAAAAIVGKAQDIFNGLQGQLYSFRVTGPITNPKVVPVAVPILTQEVGGLFQKMAGTQKQGAMADELSKQKEEAEK